MDHPRAGRRRLGVLGTLVWDTIHGRSPNDSSSESTVEEWGGIAYALVGLEAALGRDWEIVPLVKLGSDLAGEAEAFLATLPRLRTDALRIVPEPGNRVELRYVDDARRTERLTGGVPGWSPAELEPILDSLDALYVNFISGFEMDLATARWVRERFRGPIYADLHSLFLGVSRSGERFDQQLANATGWLQSFNAVQMNEAEFNLLGATQGSPWRTAAAALGDPLKLVAVTTGPRGAGFVASRDFRPDPMSWCVSEGALRREGGAGGQVGPDEQRQVHVNRPGEAIGQDPTGCGDVWGATVFARLLDGDPLEEAMKVAHEAASQNAQLKGAGSLHEHLLRAAANGESNE